MDEVDLELIRDMLRYSEMATRLLGSANSTEFEPNVPWSEVVGMRHHLVHGYRKVRPEIIVKTVREDLPALIGALKDALRSAGR